MSHTHRRLIALGLATCFLVALAISLSARASSQEALDVLLARYDRESDGAERDTLAAEVDTFAHQKYATVSRLYWHTDLALAESAARESQRPILYLRMLGRLDEDLSCANSRLFRATLYANQDVSQFLREHFVLYWSSERPVPRVTIDYGDGRKLEGTLTGNSAHYILDEDGHVLDVLPGLYAPTAFRRELEASLELAASVRGQDDDERAKRVLGYHMERLSASKREWDALAGTLWMPGARELLTQSRVETSLVAAQRATFSKAAIEIKRLSAITTGLAPEALPEDQIEMWSTAGQVLYDIGDLKRGTPRQDLVALPDTPSMLRRPLLAPPRVLDEASRALVTRLHNAVPNDLRATDEQLEVMIARLEQTIVADTALNQLRLRPQIAREIVRRKGRIDFDTLNAWIYADVFRTPRQDAWLGLLSRDVFTGLPGDGVVIR